MVVLVDEPVKGSNLLIVVRFLNFLRPESCCFVNTLVGNLASLCNNSRLLKFTLKATFIVLPLISSVKIERNCSEKIIN